MKKKGMALLLSLAMIMSMIPATAFATEFTDMPTNWSTAALENAVANGLLKGDNGKIIPSDNLTRAQMATIVNRAFGSTEKASISSYTDVSSSAWYYADMAKAVQMQTFRGEGNKLNPDNNITREEAFVVLARAFKLTGAPESALDLFLDKTLVSQWAKVGLASLVSAGYVAGSDGKLNPKENISRAEFAQIMDNLLKEYINKEGTYTAVNNGNVMINIPNVILKDIIITGDLIIGDGVGDGDVTLDNVIVTGRTLIRGGGENSIRIIGNSNLQNIIIARVDGVVRVFAEDGTEIGEVIVDGNDDVIIEGSVGTVTVVATNITVTATNAEIDFISIEGENSNFIVGSNSTIDTISVDANNVTVEVLGEVTNIQATNQAENTTISGEGTVENVVANSDNVEVVTFNTKVTAGEGTTGVTAGGENVKAGTTTQTPKIDEEKVNESGGGGGGTTPPAIVGVSAITVTPITMTLTAGGVTGTITATVAPSNATNKSITWSSSNTNVATVVGGVVTPLIAGTATITVTTVDGNKTATCGVIVEAVLGATTELTKITDTVVKSVRSDTADTKEGVEAAMLIIANAEVDSNYTVTIAEGSTYVVETNVWVGKFVVTHKTDTANTKTDASNRNIIVVIRIGRYMLDNDLNKLGLIGTSVTSSNPEIATAQIVPNSICIDFLAPGTATITVRDALNHEATIYVTVENGAGTIGKITPYAPTITVTDVPTESVTTETKALEDNSTGQITGFVADGRTPIAVTLTKGSLDYSNVRVIVTGLNDGVQLIAQDTSYKWYNIIKTGWGPAAGFALADATTNVYLVANTAGSYTATINLVDVSSGNAILATTTAESITAEPAADVTAPTATIDNDAKTITFNETLYTKTGDVLFATPDLAAMPGFILSAGGATGFTANFTASTKTAAFTFTGTPTFGQTLTYTGTIYDAAGNVIPANTLIAQYTASGWVLVTEAIVDKTALGVATTTINAKAEADFTAASWTTFTAAKTSALALPETTQTEVDAKTVAINAAIAMLVVNNGTQAVVTVGSLAVTEQYGLALNFTINEGINFGERANVKISYFTKVGTTLTPIVNTITHVSLVKDKTWDGYLWSGTEAAPVKYSQGTAGVTSFLNVIPTNTTLYTLVKNGLAAGMDYTAITDWTVPATYVVEIQVTDNDGNVSTIQTAEVTVEAPAPVVDKVALEAAKTAMNAKAEADFTVASWTTFTAAKTLALALLETTQTEVDAKTVAINAAIAGLISSIYVSTSIEELGNYVVQGGAAIDSNDKVQTVYASLNQGVKNVYAVYNSNDISNMVEITEYDNDGDIEYQILVDLTKLGLALLPIQSQYNDDPIHIAATLEDDTSVGFDLTTDLIEKILNALI